VSIYYGVSMIDIRLETERLNLRQFTEKDAEALNSKKKVTKHMQTSFLVRLSKST